MFHQRSVQRPATALLICTLFLGSASRGSGQSAENPLDATDRRIIAYERDHSEVMANLAYLSDMIGPRLTGSARLKRANDWTAEKMKEYGLENVHLEPYTIPRGWERGVVEARVLEPNGLPISAAQLAWNPGTRGTVRGPVVLFSPQSEADLAPMKGKLKGAIVLSASAVTDPAALGTLALPGAKPLPSIPAFQVSPSTTPPTGPTANQRPFDFRRFRELQKKVDDFMRQEGVAVILRDSSKPHSLLNMTGSWESVSSITTLFVAHEHVTMLQRLLARKIPVTMEVKAESRFVKGPVMVYNTVGEIKGSEKPDEVVLLGAHLDSWDLGTGTTDNGTGSMAVLEAARLIKQSGVAPKRTIRFVLFSGEEEGLFGSKAYVEAHKSEMSKFNVVFVHDTGTGRVKGLWLQDRAEAKPVLDKEFDLLNGLGLLTDPANLLPGKMNGTDHASFDDAGVPAFAFNQDGAEYSLTHHSQSDTFDKARPEDLKQGAVVLAILGLHASEMAERYPRK